MGRGLEQGVLRDLGLGKRGVLGFPQDSSHNFSEYRTEILTATTTAVMMMLRPRSGGRDAACSQYMGQELAIQNGRHSRQAVNEAYGRLVFELQNSQLRNLTPGRRSRKRRLQCCTVHDRA